MEAGLTIVVPLYNEALGLARLHAQLSDVARGLASKRGLPVEVVYVDDGSRDDTLAIAHSLPASALDVQVVGLSRNFGKEAALAAGLDHAKPGAVLFMDGDGQHPPALIETLVRHWQDDGYDVVYTAKADRESEPALRRLGGKMFYALLNWGARHKIPEDAGDFRLLSPRAADALRRMPERNRFFKGLASWIGFRQLRVDYQPDERAAWRDGLRGRFADRPFDRGADIVLGRAAAAREPARIAARVHRAHLRRLDAVRGAGLWRRRAGLSLGGRRVDGARRRAARHDRRARRVHRQDPLRAEGAADLFRRRAQREEGRIRSDTHEAGGARTAAE